MAWILEKVRDTTRLGCRAMSGTALRYAASSGNSTYASSTRNVTRGSACALHSSISPARAGRRPRQGHLQDPAGAGAELHVIGAHAATRRDGLREVGARLPRVAV